MIPAWKWMLFREHRASIQPGMQAAIKPKFNESSMN
jgi:hypothetical protein